MKHTIVRSAILILAITFTAVTSLQAQALPSAPLARDTHAAIGQTSSPPSGIRVPLGSTFTYQGRLLDGETPVEDTCNFRFELWDDPNTGVQVGPTLTVADVVVSDGRFTAQLDFGSAFDGTALWLDIAVQCSGDLDYSDLDPRQPLTAAPYSLYSQQAPWVGIAEMPAGFSDGVDDDVLGGMSCAAGQIAEWSGSAWVCGDDDTGSGGGDAWSINGNTGTDPTLHFLGTTDAVSLVLAVSGTAGLRLEPTTETPNLIGGYGGNAVASGIAGAAIGGGGASGYENLISADYGTIAGGRNNRTIGYAATVGGGEGNQGNHVGTTIAGGLNNTVSTGIGAIGGGTGNTVSGIAAAIAGGRNNAASADHAALGGGEENTILGAHGAIGGGYQNVVTGTHASIGGGSGNGAGGDYASIGGGLNNIASLTMATVGGGWNNTADSTYTTVAGGRNNVASGSDATVGGGIGNEALQSVDTVAGGSGNTADGPWATVGGGVGNTASGGYSTVPGGEDNVAEGTYSFAAGRNAQANSAGCFVWGDSHSGLVECNTSNSWVVRSSGGVSIYSSSTMGTGVYLAASGNSWQSISDRASKENFLPIDGPAVLEQLIDMPLYDYNIIGQDPSIRHIGPVAQDFALLDYGESDTAINMEDADGVAFAAIQGLYTLLQERDARIAALEAENTALREQLHNLETRVSALESGPMDTAHSQPTALLVGTGTLLAGAAVGLLARKEHLPDWLRGGRS